MSDCVCTSFAHAHTMHKLFIGYIRRLLDALRQLVVHDRRVGRHDGHVDRLPIQLDVPLFVPRLVGVCILLGHYVSCPGPFPTGDFPFELLDIRGEWGQRMRKGGGGKGSE